MIVVDFTTALSPIDKSFSQSVNKETSELSDTIYQMKLTDVYRVFHPATAQYAYILSLK
jgi:hypothetical protein